MPDVVTRSAVPASWPALASGLIVGAMAVVMAVSFAVLVFSGPLSGLLPQGLGFALLASAAGILGVAALSSLPGTVGGLQSLPVALLAGAAASLTAGAPGVEEHRLLPTVLAALASTTVLTGAVLWLLGWAGAGRVARYMPYPVLAGVLAGSAWLLGKGALGIMSAPGVGLHAAQVLPGLLGAAVLLAVNGRWPHPLALLAAVAAGIAGFHAAAAWLGQDAASLAEQGWLLPPVEGAAAPLPLLAWLDLRAVDWAALARLVPELAIVPVVAAVALLLNAMALETAVCSPVDLDRELRAAGAANLAGGLLGGLPGYQQLGLSVMNHHAGADTRWVGVWAAAVCLAAMAVGPAVISGLPRAAMGALLLFIALTLLRDGWGTWGRLSRLDQGIVAGMVAVTATAGMLPAVMLGLAAAVVLFALHYGRIDPVRQVLHGDRYGSRVTRPSAQAAQLKASGAGVCILQLQGFLFFGLADRLLLCARQRLEDAGRPALRTLVLDCRRVTGCDSTAAQSFSRLYQLLASHGAVLQVAHAPASVLARLDAAGLDAGRCARFDDLDHALEHGESQLLAASPCLLGPGAAPGTSLHDALAQALGGAERAGQFLAQLPRRALCRGEVLIRQGDIAGDLYLLDSGVLSARRARPGGPDMRLQVLRGSGLVVGEVGFYTDQPRTAAVVADEDSVVYRLPAELMLQLEQVQPALAAAVHRWLATLLAGRVAHLVGALDSLEA